MKIIGITGSRRQNSNTGALVKAALEGARLEGADTEVIELKDYSIGECNGCDSCLETHRCIINDDMQKLYPLLLNSEGLILGSPSYFYSVSGNIKTMLDRLYCFEAFADNDRSVWLGICEALGLKYAAIMAVSGQASSRDMGYTAEIMEQALASIGYRTVDKVLAHGFFEQGTLKKDRAILDKARAAGKKLAKTIVLQKKVEQQLQVSITKPAF